MVEFPAVSADQNEVAVIAKVTDLDKWIGLSEVRVGAALGAVADDRTQIVTARIPIQRIENVRQQPFVKSLKATQPLQPVLNATTEETGASPGSLPAGNQTNGGEGVLVGIVDYGCDFKHENFRDAGGGTRLLSIWHQAGKSGPQSPFGYGKEYTADQINTSLQQLDPYGALGYGPEKDSIFQTGTHGTHVMDIAAGNGRGSEVAGVAPQADLVFVDVSINSVEESDIPLVGPAVVGSSFGDSTRLLEAIQYIFNQAGDRPCVVNVSLGTNGGPHDGSTLVEEGIDRLVRQAPNRAVVIAAANAFDDGIHAEGTVEEGGHSDLIWEIPSADFSHNEFELWYSDTDEFAVELFAPGGQSLGQVDPGQNGELTVDNQVVIFVANRLNEPNNGDNMIGIFLESGLPDGRWSIRIHGVTVTDGSYHAWIERDNVVPSQFAPPHDNSHTIGSLSCGHETLVVGSYDGHKTSLPLSFFSSAGPTRDGREKPEVSAPGHNVFAAHSRTNTGVTRKSGTSMAAPAVTGIVALMFAEAQSRGVDLNIADIRNIIINTSRQNPPAGTGWDQQYGHGRISASAAVQAVMTLGQAPVPTAKRTRKPRKKAAAKPAGKKRTTKKKATTKPAGKKRATK
jgi:subtilisin family serine protease